MCVWVCALECRCRREQKRALDTLELELQADSNLDPLREQCWLHHSPAQVFLPSGPMHPVTISTFHWDL